MSEEKQNLGGRPSKWSPEVGARICAAVRKVGFGAVAAELNGIHRSTLERWLERGRESNDNEELADFAAAYDKAKAEWSESQLNKLEQSPAWLLERADRQFRPQTDTNTTHSGGVAINFHNLSEDELKQHMREALEGGNKDG